MTSSRPNEPRGIKPFECPFCGLRFRLKHSRYNHVRLKHADQPSKGLGLTPNPALPVERATSEGSE